MADVADDETPVEQTPEFSQRLSAISNSAFWSASRPGGHDWEAGPDHPPGSCTYEVASAWESKAVDERDEIIDECAKYADYEDLPDQIRGKIDTIERFNEVWFDLEERAIAQATEQLSFVPVGQIPLTAGEKEAAKEAAKMAADDGKPEIAKWFTDSLDSNPNAVRSVLAQMGLDDEE